MVDNTYIPGVGTATMMTCVFRVWLQSNPPPEGNAAETTIGELDPDTLGALSYTFDMGDNWEHYIELQDTREGGLDGDPAVVDEQGAAPPQYPDLDEQ
jgi:hypothetical protein